MYYVKKDVMIKVFGGDRRFINKMVMGYLILIEFILIEWDGRGIVFLWYCFLNI